MKRLFRFILSISFILIASSFQTDPAIMFDKMIEKNHQIKTLIVSVGIKERVKGKVIEKKNDFIINANPYKVYFTEVKYGINIEGLFIPGKNNNMAKIATKGFPWMNMDLDPFGSKMRNETHHTIYGAGFDYFIQLLDNIKKRNGSNFSSMITNLGLFKRGTLFFYKLEMNIPGFQFVEYTVKKGENLPSIANKLNVNDFMILEKNPSLKDYFDVKEGQKILVPTEYAKKMVFHLDRDLMLPIYVELYDDQGFYASYTFSNITINSKVDDSVFDVHNPNYHFK